MSAKDNFAQAMKELLNTGDADTAGKDEEKKGAPSGFSSFSQPDSRPPKAPAPEKKAEPAAEKQDDAPAESPSASVFGGGPLRGTEPEAVPAVDEVTENAAGTAPAEEAAPVTQVMEESVEVSAMSQPRSMTGPGLTAQQSADGPVVGAPALGATDDVTVIAAGTTIVGDVNTAGGLKVGGDIKGNVKVATKLELTGKVIGDIEAEDAEITNSIIRGNISVKKVITVDGTSTVVGDVAAQNCKIDGKIKGNLTVEERGHFESHATLVGNLISGTVIIDEGAMLKGDIAITNAQNENISVDEPDFDIEI